MRGRGGGDLLEVGDALGGLEHAMDQQRALEPGFGLELREQAIGVMDVPGTLDLGDHDHLELVPDLSHELGDVVEEVGRGELVDTRPQRGFAEVHLTPDLDQPGARGLLLFQRDGVLEVAEQDVHLRREVRRLLDHFRVREVDEVDHPGRLERDLPRGLGGVDREGLEEVAGVAQGGSPGVGWGPNGTRRTVGEG